MPGEIDSRSQPTFLDRVAVLSSWVLAVAVFLTVGWLAMAPDDPMGPLSVYARGGGTMMLVQAAALAGVVAGLATVVAGRQLTDAGVFATALGLVVVSLRANTASSFLVEAAGEATSLERALAGRFALEAVGWWVVMLVSIVSSAFVMRWCFGSATAAEGDKGRAESFVLPALAGTELPWLAPHFGDRGAVEERTPVSDGWKHAVIAAGIALVAFAILSEGLSQRSVQHGQACFVVGASVFAGVWVGYRFIPVRTAMWPIASVLAFAILGYLWAALRPSSGLRPPQVPLSQFTRILPIQFIAVGTAAALVSFWYLYIPVAESKDTNTQHARGRKG